MMPPFRQRELEMLERLFGERGTDRAVRISDLIKERARPPGQGTIRSEHLAEGDGADGSLFDYGYNSVTNSRYLRFGGRRMLCWGKDMTSSSGDVTITFPAEFSSTNGLAVVFGPTMGGALVYGAAVSRGSFDATSYFVMRARRTDTQAHIAIEVSWFALGTWTEA